MYRRSDPEEQPNTGTTVYYYDGAGNMIKRIAASGAVTQYTYDANGNRLSQTLGAVTTNYGYGTGSDLLSTQSVGGMMTQTLGYTADGRMASFSPGIQAPGGEYITSISYNQDARLAAVNSGDQSLVSNTF